MGTCSSSTNILGWAVAQRRCLNDSTIPVKATTLDPKLAAKGCQINLHCHFTRALFFSANKASPAVEKGESFQNIKKKLTNGLIFNFITCSMGIFHTANEERCGQGYGPVHANLLKHNPSYLSDNTRTFSSFSVGCCINRGKVICYQLEFGK